jgi:hypothetical protein
MNALIPALGPFIGLLFLAGAGAYVSGRAMALTWRPLWLAVFYMLPLAGAARFLHYALFEEQTDIAQYALAFALLSAIATAGFFIARRAQMKRQYPWIASSRNADAGSRAENAIK